MADCDADPAIMAWASRYTRNPKQFESQLRSALPHLAYVQQVAGQYDVAGEFVLLPWVESHFHPAPTGKRHRSAGMWQLMPVTAGAMGLRVDRQYDGRLDVPAATHAVMKLLERYHDQFHDWRVADYAYNAGEFSVRRIVRSHGMPAERPVIPDWPVRKVTREHLAKLLAIACVVREPARFHVSLPSLPDQEHLVKTAISHSMPITQAADHAGMPADALKQLNPAFRGSTIDAGAASYLLLPASHAKQFREAMPAQASDVSSGGKGPAGAQTAPRTHTVKRGDSLWQIARDYAVGVGQLQRWNRLQGQALKPGQVLQVSAAN
ncbi:LysM peptidoglycan-binding domain-containing protein [Rhodanobacter denitrificans]|uniref:LysM peptidoglycan-binding domain-containing protein n=1 Tax=Rhodanobacter denitrificans TaxID=666685 RepID=A0A368KG77_9GAMM|nr:transglycosylase SLT domain-containing protein [Rhodanobacter denitrificans]RCS30847.1 LysM peptidoglycan-binding domain-containing protein [Rhodanobacter denitrificans]